MSKNLKKFFLEVELSDKNEPFLFVVHGKITHDTTLAAAEKVKASAPLKTSHQTSPNFFSNSRNVVKNRRLTLAEQLSVLEKKILHPNKNNFQCGKSPTKNNNLRWIGVNIEAIGATIDLASR